MNDERIDVEGKKDGAPLNKENLIASLTRRDESLRAFLGEVGGYYLRRNR